MKNIHDGNVMECPELHKTYVFYYPTSTGGLSPIIIRNIFDGRCLECTEMYDTHIF